MYDSGQICSNNKKAPIYEGLGRFLYFTIIDQNDYLANTKPGSLPDKIEDLSQRIEHLSGGQLKRIALANVLISEPELLILDEPTNHLDLDMIEWFEDYLIRSKMSLVFTTVSGAHYELNSSKPRSAVKYLAYYGLLKKER